MTNIVLATASPYKRRQFEVLQLPFECRSADLDETPLTGERPKQTAIRLATQKAQFIAEQQENAYVIGCDQTASIGDQALKKPGTMINAAEQLALCSGKSATFYSSVSIVNTEKQLTLNQTTETQVKFRELNQEHILSYIKKEDALDCAGGFKIERLGIRLFEHVRSDDPSALIGLPMIALVTLLLQLGIEPLK